MPIRNMTSVQIIVSYGIEMGIEEDLLLQGSGLLSSQLRDHDGQVEDTLLRLGLTASMQDIADYLSRTIRTLHRQLKQE